MKKILATAIAFASFNALAVTLPTAKGDIEITKTPERIAVYDIGALDTLVSLGLGDKIVGIPDFETQFATPNAKKVGTLREPDLEALSAVQPDLIIVAQRTAGKLEEVSKVAQSVDVTLNSENFYQEGLKRLDDFAKVFAKTEEAKKVTDKLNALRDEVKELAKDRGNVLSLLVSGPKISLYGADSRANFFQSEIGLNLITEPKKTGKHGEPVTFEYVAEKNPDWIIAYDRLAAIKHDGASAKETLSNKLVEGTTAWKKGQIIYVDANNIYINIGGPSALTGALEELKTAFKK